MPLTIFRRWCNKHELPAPPPTKSSISPGTRGGAAADGRIAIEPGCEQDHLHGVGQQLSQP
jgi:hypothetical protein